MPSDCTLTRMLSPSTRSAYRDQILGELIYYTESLYYTSPESSPTTQIKWNERHSGNWFAMIPHLPDITVALETSILAFCIARLGRLRDDRSLVHESLKFYSQGLFELQKALWDPKLMHRDETVAACMALVFYEATECPSESIAGWQSHMRGCVKMFELKGADAYRSEFGHQIFLSFRIMEVCMEPFHQMNSADRSDSISTLGKTNNLPRGRGLEGAALQGSY